MSNTIKACQLPEFIHHFAPFVPVWAMNKTYEAYDFHPRDLVACLQVCRAWHHILTPYLWEVFDASAMSVWNIPPEVLAKHSSHCWYVALGRKETYPLQCLPTRLRGLHLSLIYQVETATNLIRANPSLTKLHWLLPGQARNYDVALVRSALETLSNLQELYLLSLTDPCTDGFGQILGNNPDLRTLTLSCCDNLRVSPECKPFMAITYLDIASQWRFNPGLVNLVRKCPSLETLVILAESSCPATELATALKDCCPRLTSLRCFRGYMERTIDRLLDPVQHAQLIMSTPRLVDYRMTMACLTPLVADVLSAHHAHWMHTLHLDILIGNRDHFLSVGKLLGLLSSLVDFFMVDRKDGWRVEDGLAMFETVWDCPKLEKLSLDGFETRYGNFDPDESDENEYVLEAPPVQEGGNIEGGNNQVSEEDGIDDTVGDENMAIQHTQGVEDSLAELVNDDQATIQSPPEPERIVVGVAIDKEFSEILAQNGWNVSANSRKQRIRGPARVIRDKVFDRVFSMPSMVVVVLESVEYCKVGRARQ
ncbi:hypothetical protein BG005_005627 [Podila minutissima]|nr:hypothetical protein BG005_005627 [Podila minutissima]